MNHAHQKNRNGFYLGGVSAIFGLVVLYLSGDDSVVPGRSALLSATGPVQSIVKQKSSVKFALKGVPHHFQFLSKSGNLLPVYQALSGAGGAMITVLFDPTQSWQPVLDENAYHTVFEIRVADRSLVSYEQARDAWQADQGVGDLLGMAFLFTGVAMVAFAKFR